jgi:type I restriction enzyme R subunit
MPAPSEHKTACLCVSARRRVQARILHYAQEIGWTYVPRDEAERRRGFDPDGATPEKWARKASLFFGDLIDCLMTAQIRGQDLDLPELTSFTAKGTR